MRRPTRRAGGRSRRSLRSLSRPRLNAGIVGQLAMAVVEDEEYPSRLDVAWVAVDRLGRIGVFTTGGQGPIPKVYLRDDGMLDRLFGAIDALPVVSAHRLFSDVPRPDDFIGFARRGLFSFDWSDVHRTHGLVNAYEIQARPVSPVIVSTAGFTASVVADLGAVTSNLLDFDAPTVNVLAALECAALPAVAAERASRRR